MACITFIAQPLAMATTQLARVVHYSAEPTWQRDDTQRNLHVSWVVTTDSRGHRTLQMQWTSADKSYD